MKKFLVLICAACLLIGGCGSDKVQRIGMIEYENVTEEAFNKQRKKIAEEQHEDLDFEYIFFKNMTSMLLALKSGQIDYMSTYEGVAKYLVKNNSDLEYEPLSPELTDVFCCAMRKEDTNLKEEFDKAILKMTRDGTLTKLVKKYIAEFYFDQTPPIIEMPRFYNDSVVKVGVTGDLPMLDYIRPDGIPAGFNTAVLAEISRLIGRNFIIVQIDSGARAAALASGEVDVIFWAVVPQMEELIPLNVDKPDGVILTVPYFSDKNVHVKLR